MIEKMPQEYKGEVGKQTEYTHTPPREWTQKEIEWLLEKHQQGYSKSEIAYSMDRTEVSVGIKLKRLSKKNDSYNQKHLEDKYEFNKTFLDIMKPKTILDLYCGEKSYYKNLGGYEVVSNDKEPTIKADYHKDALRLLCELYAKDCKFDLIDLDPFGSAYDCFDLAIKMAKTSLVITLGELGHKRWKRLDYVSRFYGIDKIENFTINNLIKHIQEIGIRNKKNLIVVFQKEWENIGRVWFRIEPLKVIKSQIKESDQLNLFDIDYDL